MHIVIKSCWFSFCLGALALMPNDSVAAEFTPPMLEKPYAPLMIPVGGGKFNPMPTQEQIEQIARTYVFVNSHAAMVNPSKVDEGMMVFPYGPSGGKLDNGQTVGEAIKAINPNFTLSNYRNGSYIAQNCPNEAEEVETRFPLGIAVHNTSTTLSQDITAEETAIRISKAPKIPKGMPEIYPFKASTAEGEHSKSPKEYVAWLRLDDEVIRIDEVKAEGDELVFTAKRGIWGTQAVPHKTGSIVFQPVYIGSVTAGGDTALSGVPDNKSPQLGIRYGLQLQNKEFQKWLAEKCKVIFDEGYDVAWLDITESNWYNNGNAYGRVITPWNLELNREMDHDTFREYQQQKLDYLFEQFPGKSFWGNNIKGSSYFRNGTEKKMLSGEGGHTPMSGGSMEVYANVKKTDQWREIVDMTLDFVKNNYWGVAWSKGGQDRLKDYRMFAYCTYLLAYDPNAERKLMFARGEGANVLEKLEDYFYYDLGAVRPVTNLDPLELSFWWNDPKVEGLYCRQYERAFILVNPSDKTFEDLKLDRQRFDAETKTVVDQVTLRPWTAKLLMETIGPDEWISGGGTSTARGKR